MKRMIWAAVTMTALAAPLFAQSAANQKPSTTTAPAKSVADVQRDRDKVKQDRATLKADQAAGHTATVAQDQAQLKKDRAELRADMKAAGVTPKHHKKATNDAKNTLKPSTSK